MSISEKAVADILHEWLWAKKRVVGEGRDSQEHFDVMGIDEAVKRIAALPLQQCRADPLTVETLRQVVEDGNFSDAFVGSVFRKHWAELKAALAAAPPAPQAAPSGLENLKAILADQPYRNSALSVIEIETILENGGGLMPDEAVSWFRSARGNLAAAPPAPEEDRGARIYIASRASIPERAAMWRDFRDQGANIISSWIDESGEGETADFGELWVRIFNEIAICDRLVLYVEPDDFPLKGALIETGMALGLQKPVTVCMPGVVLNGRTHRPIGSWIEGRSVTRCDDIRSALIAEKDPQS